MYVASDVFRENYLPREMPGRGRELRALSNVLEPLTEDEPAGSVWEIGPSGVGKTSTAKYLLDEAEQLGVAWTYVQCVGSTRWQLLMEIADAHPSVPAKNNLGVDALRERLATPSLPFVVVLDEVGGLEDPALLTDLVDLEWISLICIGHDRGHALDRVPDEADRLRFADVVEFEPYLDEAMFRILDARREAGLEMGVVTDDQLGRIIAEAGGSARFGVQALRSAVDLALERKHTRVRGADVDDCFEHAHERIREQQLRSLGQHHHLVYEVIREHGPLRAQRIFERYQRRTREPRTRQMVGQYRAKLEEYGLIEECEGGWRAVDETLAAPLRDAQPA